MPAGGPCGRRRATSTADDAAKISHSRDQPAPRHRSASHPRPSCAIIACRRPPMPRTAAATACGSAMLTGGGDCPGLNAVIRAIVRKGELHYGDELVGFLDAWDGVLDRRTMPLDVASLRGMLPRGGTVLGTRRGSPYDHADGAAARSPTRSPTSALDALIVIGGNGTLTRRHQLHDDRPADRRRAEDDRQRHRRHRRDVRLPHRRADRHRRHRPPAHHRREPRPGDGRRGDGPPRRLDRHVRRHRRRRHGDPDPRAAVRHRRGLRRILQRRHERGRYASIVVVAEGAEPESTHARPGEKVYDQFGHVRLGGIADTIAQEIEERTGFETRVVHARPRAARRHADGVRPGAVDALRRRRDRRRARPARGARWSCCAAATIDAGPARPRPSARPGPSTSTCTTTSPRCSSADPVYRSVDRWVVI